MPLRFPGKRYLDWDLPDVKDLPVEAVRAVREEIDRRVRDLIAQLDGPGAVDSGRLSLA